jgi:hypothetical protein
MLRALTEQTEASNRFRGELQQLGGQLATGFIGMESGTNGLAVQISELTVHLGADAKESHILLNKASNIFRSELRQLGSQLAVVAQVTEKGHEASGAKIAEVMAQMAAETKESQQLFADANQGFRGELQQLGSQLATIFTATGQGSEAICSKISELMARLAAEADKSQQLLDQAGNTFRGELQQLGSQLATIFTVTEEGNGEICTKISELMDHRAAAARESQQLLETAGNNFRRELQQLGSQLGTIFNVTEKGNGEISTQIIELMVHRAADAKETNKLLAMLVNDQEAVAVHDQEG